MIDIAPCSFGIWKLSRQPVFEAEQERRLDNSWADRRLAIVFARKFFDIRFFNHHFFKLNDSF